MEPAINESKTTGANMKSIKEVIELAQKKPFVIPLLQRNYKWTMECASELAEDLWNAYFTDKDKAYQLNMITLYDEKTSNRFLVIDGQQRLITLKLLLTFLQPEQKDNLEFVFERDLDAPKEMSRQNFINSLNKSHSEKIDHDNLSVDIERLYQNYMAMSIPLSFRTVIKAFSENDKLKEEQKRIVNEKIRKGELSETNEERKRREEQEKNDCKDKLKNNLFALVYKLLDKETADNLLNDDHLKEMERWYSQISKKIASSGIDIISSSEAHEFQLMWQKVIADLPKPRQAVELAEFIKEKVQVLLHATHSEPIDEFLNINENKTRFVISDYIRAKMINDNHDEQTRKNILELFAELASFLYSKEHNDLWELVSTWYDNFDKNPDINRLKVLFCDRYAGTNISGYDYENENTRLSYYKKVLNGLSREIKSQRNGSEPCWNTYNAAYALIRCKKNRGFFSLFSDDDVKNSVPTYSVISKEQFCFFEWVYKRLVSDDRWHVSYFLESQLYDEKCSYKNFETNLPSQNSNWCVISDLEKNGLNNAVNNLIEKYSATNQDAKPQEVTK